MFLKIIQKQCVTAEYYPIKSVVSITTIQDDKFDDSNIVAKVRFQNDTITIYKYQNAWLVNDEGKVLEVISRDYMWS